MTPMHTRTRRYVNPSTGEAPSEPTVGRASPASAGPNGPARSVTSRCSDAGRSAFSRRHRLGRSTRAGGVSKAVVTPPTTATSDRHSGDDAETPMQQREGRAIANGLLDDQERRLFDPVPPPLPAPRSSGAGPGRLCRGQHADRHAVVVSVHNEQRLGPTVSSLPTERHQRPPRNPGVAGIGAPRPRPVGDSALITARPLTNRPRLSLGAVSNAPAGRLPASRGTLFSELPTSFVTAASWRPLRWSAYRVCRGRWPSTLRRTTSPGPACRVAPSQTASPSPGRVAELALSVRSTVGRFLRCSIDLFANTSRRMPTVRLPAAGRGARRR